MTAVMAMAWGMVTMNVAMVALGLVTMAPLLLPQLGWSPVMTPKRQHGNGNGANGTCIRHGWRNQGNNQGNNCSNVNNAKDNNGGSSDCLALSANLKKVQKWWAMVVCSFQGERAQVWARSLFHWLVVQSAVLLCGCET